MLAGTVRGLHRWPVKSLRGEDVSAARLDDRGMAGDRAHALVDGRRGRDGKVRTVRQDAGMLGWSAAYGDVPDPVGPPELRGPDGTTWTWGDPELAEALTTSLGGPLDLRAAPGQQDRGPTVLVTFQASLDGLAEELGAEVDLRRFRTNLHLEADLPAFAEQRWEPGVRLAVGEVELAVTGEHSGPCVRCAVPSWDAAGRERWRGLQQHLIGAHDNLFGVIMRVTRAGDVRVGDEAGEPSARV